MTNSTIDSYRLDHGKLSAGVFQLIEDVHVQLVESGPGVLEPDAYVGQKFRYGGRWVIIVGNSYLAWYVRYLTPWERFMGLLFPDKKPQKKPEKIAPVPPEQGPQVYRAKERVIRAIRLPSAGSGDFAYVEEFLRDLPKYCIILQAGGGFTGVRFGSCVARPGRYLYHVVGTSTVGECGADVIQKEYEKVS